MKDATQELHADGSRRGIFRRGRRGATSTASAIDIVHPDAPDAPAAAPSVQVQEAVDAVDDLARRMDELAGIASAPAGATVADEPIRATFDLQRAVIARANDLAAATSTSTVPNDAQTSPDTTASADGAATTAVEVPVQPIDTDATRAGDDIEARLDAALGAVTPPSPAPQDAPVTVPTTARVAPPVDAAPAQQPASLEPTNGTVTLSAITSPGLDQDAVSLLGIDLNRVVRTIQEEAVSVRQRIEFEVRDAHVQATDIIDRAEDEAERIREHGQAQARVLLGEVEEIISEAQQTGEQILHRANEEASSLRGDATTVLQQAQAEARAIVESARREGEQVLAEQRRLATVRAQEAMREQDRLKDQIRRLEERRRQVLESLEPLISQLTQMMPAGAAAAADHNVVQLERQRATAAPRT